VPAPDVVVNGLAASDAAIQRVLVAVAVVGIAVMLFPTSHGAKRRTGSWVCGHQGYQSRLHRCRRVQSAESGDARPFATRSVSSTKQRPRSGGLGHSDILLSAHRTRCVAMSEKLVSSQSDIPRCHRPPCLRRSTPANSLPGAPQVPFGGFTGFHYVALDVTNPMKWHAVTPTET
jgi:hypothetical protein